MEVVVRKGKKRKRAAVLRDRKEDKGKGQTEGYYLAILLQVVVKDL